MIGMNFEGVRHDTIRLSTKQIEELKETGRTIAGFGTWKDGTPAFIYVEMEREVDGSDWQWREIKIDTKPKG